MKIDLYVSLSTEEAQLLANLNNKRTSKKVFFQVSMSFMIFLWIFYFGGGLGVSGHHFPYLLFPSIINPRLLYLHRFFFVVGRSWERVLLLPSLLTSYYFVFSIYHTQPPPTLQLHWFYCGGGSESECFSFFFNPITSAFFIHHSTSSSSFFLAGFFNEKFRLIDWRWSVWRAASTIRLKFCFLTITQMFLNGIDWYLEH